ncbi:MAG: CTP synthase [Candidatus Omnitrophica bacterium]|nr:CTP synthase [Candidatus Omnitrophota bacterium]
MPKYIFITGGVISSLGKGIASASIGKLLESRGLTVSVIKCDPYINVDAGTMNPYQHGEVYVTRDGAETDLDLGHYERFTNAELTKDANVTTGKIYHAVITKERRGDYLGKTVQVIPHITDEIKTSIRRVTHNRKTDVCIVEIGGTVGDIESLPFLEAIRQMELEEGLGNSINIHLTLVPFIKTAGELKTKPTQHSVGKLREIGMQPDILLCRCERVLSRQLKEKIALFCNVHPEAVIPALDASTIYEIPLLFSKAKLEKLILKLFDIKGKTTGFLRQWEAKVVRRIKHPKHSTRIAVVGKYITLQDAYKSIYEALIHGGITHNTKVEIKKVDSEDIQKRGAAQLLGDVSGILIPGGFGYRGIEGKIQAIQYARENNIPFFGICLGMQTAVIEFARNICGLAGANSSEFDSKTKYPVISLLSEQKSVKFKGGTMRLGSYDCELKKNTKTYQAYKKAKISERHRHRYEFNNEYRKLMEDNGFVIAGTHPQKNLVEIIELKDHPFFIACQFHPEFQSKPDAAHPIFAAFIKASLK